MRASLIGLVVLFSSLGFSKGEVQYKDIPECVTVGDACTAAGFVPGMHKKNEKGLWADCVGQIAKGKTVEKVANVTKDDAKACMKAKRMAKNTHGKGAAVAPALEAAPAPAGEAAAPAGDTAAPEAKH